MMPLERLACLLGLAGSVAACTHHKTSLTPPSPAPRPGPIVQRTDPKLVDLVVEPTTPIVLANAQDELGIHVRVTAKTLPDAHRPPIDLALVLDTSGSMEGDAIVQLRASADAFVDKLHDGDRLSLITFDSRATVLVPSTAVDAASRAKAHLAIANIVAHGTTDLQAGLALGASQLATHQRSPLDIERIVLLSDGVPNSAETLPSVLAQIKAAGYSVTTLGLGLDYDTTLMTRIASDTGGAFHYIEKPEQIAAVFDDELAKLSTVVAKNLQLVLSPGPGVTFEPLAGFTFSGTRIFTALGDLPAGATRDLVLPIRLVARGKGSIAELVDVSLGYEDVIGQSGHQERTGYASAKASGDAAEVAAAIKPDLEVMRVKAAAASAILEAMDLARSGRMEPAKKRLGVAVTMVKAAQTRLKNPALDPVLAELASVTKDIAQMVLQQPAVSSDVPRPSTMPAPAMAPEMTEHALRRSQEKAAATVHGF